MSYKHSNGDLWYSGNNGGGIVRVDAKTNKIIHYEYGVNGAKIFDSSYYPYVAEDSRGDLWFGVNKSSSLLHWSFKSQTFDEITFSKFTNKIAILGGINHLICDKKDNLWIAYDGNGLVHYNTKSKRSKLYTIENGLPTNYIGSLEWDTKNRLWIITAKGLFCFIPKHNKMLQMTIWDGFADNPLNYNILKMDASKNRMWLGAMKCIYYFNPDEIIKNKITKGKLFLDDIKVNNTQVTVFTDKAVTFLPDDNNFQFDIVAIDMENGKNIEYSYKLEGFNQDWTYIGSNRTILFPKLKSGNYSFNARARYKGSNDWFYLTKSFVFTIQTHWYLTWWFKMLTFIFIVFLIWLALYFNFRKRLEKQQAIEEERNRIAADMHDDLGSGLTKITYLSQMALQKENNKELLTGIKTTSTQLVASMSEIIWAMKEENNTWEELLSYIKLYAQEYGQNNGLQVHFIFPEDDMNFAILGEVRRHIFLSVKECLHNVVKHADAANITILIVKKAQTIEISIQDDGKGMDKNNDHLVGGNGLKNLAQRMDKINGSFSIIQNLGTTILFQIPY
jgi:two-component sensor histidine kinase